MTMKSKSDTTRTRTLFTLAGDHRALNLDVLGVLERDGACGELQHPEAFYQFWAVLLQLHLGRCQKAPRAL